GLGSWCDLRFNLRRIEKKCGWVYIGKDRPAALKYDTIGAGDKREGRDNDFVIRPDVQGSHRSMQGGGAVGHCDSMRNAHRGGKRLLKLLDLGAGGQPGGAQRFRHSLDVVIVYHLVPIG